MMNEKLIAALSDIDEEMIADAAPGKTYGQPAFAVQPEFAQQTNYIKQSERVRRRRGFYRVAALAACFCVVVALIAVIKPWSSADKNEMRANNAMPMPASSTKDLENETAEYSGGVSDGETKQHQTAGNSNTAAMPDYSACKGSEDLAVDENLPKIGKLPETEDMMKGSGAGAGLGSIGFVPGGSVVPGAGFIAEYDVPEKLAVYHHDGAVASGEPVGLDNSQMTELLNTYAERLGIEFEAADEITYEDESGKQRLFYLKAGFGDYEIQVDAGARVVITIPESDVPEDINSILQFNDPVIKESWDYSGDDYIKEGSYVYENGDPLKYAWMWEPSDGLVRLHIQDYGLVTEKVADYPVISPAKALEMLKAGHYSAPLKNKETEFPGEDQIVGLRIEYVLSPAFEYIVPYYVFTVMLPDMTPEAIYSEYGIKDAAGYVEYYVPAIDERYFESVPLTWN